MIYKITIRVEDAYLFDWIEVLKKSIEKHVEHSVLWWDWMVIEKDEPS